MANRVLLSRAIDALIAAGADEITVLADRDAAPRLRSSIEGVGCAIHWIPCVGACDAGTALLAASEAVGGERFLVHSTDGLWLGRSTRPLRALASDDHDAFLLVRPVAEHALAARVTSDQRPPMVLAEAPSAHAELCGLHGFSRAILAPLRDTDCDGGSGRLLEAVQALATAGGRIGAADGHGWWSYTGTADELLEANRIVLDGMGASQARDHRDGLDNNRIEGRVAIDPTVVISGSFIRGPVVIGGHATITDAYIGPYTSIGEAATIDNAEIESSVVLTGARIRHIGTRLDRSLIGAGASVGRTFEQPRAMRLVVGEDARVTLA